MSTSSHSVKHHDIVRPEELSDTRAFLDGLLKTGGFSFRCGGRPSSDVLPAWPLKTRRRAGPDGVILHTVTRADPRTGLAVVLEVKEYTRFPVIEWGVRLRNTPQRKSPLIEDVKSLDVRLALGKLPYLNYWTGDYCAQDGYEPFRVSLAHGETHDFAPLGGRPTNRAWPYYNLECTGAGRGALFSVVLS